MFKGKKSRFKKINKKHIIYGGVNVKKMLLIAPKYFSYHTILIDGFTNAGYDVDWCDDRPSQNLIQKCLIRLNRKLAFFSIRKYCRKLVKQCKQTKYDMVLVIIGQVLSKRAVRKMKEALPNAKFVYYIWDAIKNFPDRIKIVKEFDIAYTFDDIDAKTYCDTFQFLPLFLYDYKETECIDSYKEYKYDFSFVGTIKKGKYKFLTKLFNQIELENRFIVYKYYYLQSKLLYFFYKLTDKSFKNAKLNDFKYEKLSLDVNNEIALNTHYIIDCPMKNQNGLSIRTFESLSQHKKLITTNRNVINYDFYNKNNIYIYDGNFIDFNDDFFTTEYEEIEESIIKKYTLENWIKTIEGGN